MTRFRSIFSAAAKVFKNAKQVLTKRAGTIDTKAAEAAGIDLSAFRKPETIVYSIRCERRVSEVA